jgi:hypothetical protein
MLSAFCNFAICNLQFSFCNLLILIFYFDFNSFFRPISTGLSNFTMHSAALPGILARQACPAALHGRLAQQPCPAVRPISTGFDARARSLRSHRTVLHCSGRSPNCMHALLLS